MKANAFRHFYNYHFAENRKIWDQFVTQLTYEQFTHETGYSHGSVRNQLIHLISVDDVWFCELRGVAPSEPLLPASFDDRELMRAYWDAVEQSMRNYLADLHDDMLFERPIEEPEEDRGLFVWQVLLHVANHGTDHRAQILKLLNELGVKTAWQDYIFFVYDNPVKA